MIVPLEQLWSVTYLLVLVGVAVVGARVFYNRGYDAGRAAGYDEAIDDIKGKTGRRSDGRKQR